MGRTVEKLTALAVNRAKEPGYYGDGGGLYLQVSKTGNKSWISAMFVPAANAGWALVHCIP